MKSNVFFYFNYYLNYFGISMQLQFSVKVILSNLFDNFYQKRFQFILFKDFRFIYYKDFKNLVSNKLMIY